MSQFKTNRVIHRDLANAIDSLYIRQCNEKDSFNKKVMGIGGLNYKVPSKFKVTASYKKVKPTDPDYVKPEDIIEVD